MTKLTIIFLGLFLSISQLNAQDFSKLYKKNSPSIVKISVNNYDGTAANGAGFFIDENTIVTCYHIIDKANSLTIKNSNGDRFTIDSILTSNKNVDLCKLTVLEKSKSWLKINNRIVKTGEPIFTIGHPDGNDFSISNGIVTGQRKGKLSQDCNVIQTNAPSSPGSSGSPLLDLKGNVLGILSYITLSGQNLNFATSASELVNMVNDKSISDIKPAYEELYKVKFDSLVKLAEAYYKMKEYQNSLNTILPISHFADSIQTLTFKTLIGDCYFYQENYSKALRYFESYYNLAINKNSTNFYDIFMIAENNHKTAACYFKLGNIKLAIELTAQTIGICKLGIEMNQQNDIFTSFLKQIYVTDAMYKIAYDKPNDACISWKLAKEYGFNNPEINFDYLCK